MVLGLSGLDVSWPLHELYGLPIERTPTPSPTPSDSSSNNSKQKSFNQLHNREPRNPAASSLGDRQR